MYYVYSQSNLFTNEMFLILSSYVMVWNKVLGTFITEWDEGKVITRKLLETKESAHMYAERLSELAVSLGFDGWLVNTCPFSVCHDKFELFASV